MIRCDFDISDLLNRNMDYKVTYNFILFQASFIINSYNNSIMCSKIRNQ